MDQPLISVLVGAEGGASGQGASAQLIYNQLSKALASLSSQKPLEISATLQKDLKQDLQAQLGKIKGLTVDISANIKNVKNSVADKAAKPSQPGATASSVNAPATSAVSQQNGFSSAMKNTAAAINQATNASRGYSAAISEQVAAQNAAAKSANKTAAEQAKANKAMVDAQAQALRFNTYLKKLRPSVVTENADSVNRIFDLYREAQSGGHRAQETLRLANNQAKLFRENLKNIGADGGTVLDHLADKFRTFSTYLISSAASLALASSLSKAISITYQMNKAMTDLQIVTGNTKQQVASLVQEYNQMAQDLGTTTKTVSDAAVEWMRQGFSMADTNKLIKDSTVLSIVGFMNSSEAAQALTATMKGYQLSVEDAIGAVDKFTAVDMVAATSAGNIATALSKTAANAHLAGLSLDDVVGQLALVNETMQEAPETTGTFYNTMLSRMGMIKSGRLEDPETGESLSDVETVLKTLGISLRDSSREFRNFGEVLNQVGSSWENYSSVQQRAIAVAFAGTRQQSRFITLMEGWNKAAEYSKVAASSSGTAMEKFGVYQESLAAKTNHLVASFEKLTSVLINDGLIGWFMDAGAAALNFAADIGSIGGGSVATIAELTAGVILLSAAFKTVANSKIAQSFKDVFSSIYDAGKGAVEAFNTAKALSLNTSQLIQTVSQQGTRSFTEFSAALKNMDEAQLVNIATLNNQTLGTRALTAAEIEEALTQAGVEAATAKSTASKVANAAATSSQTATTAGQAAANTAEAATAGAAATATNTLTASVVGLGAAMKALLFSNPITAILTLVTVIAGAVIAFDSLTVSAEEQASKTRELSQEYSQLSSEIDSINGQLKTTRDRIAELKSQGTLTLTEQDELTKLQAQNSELERQLRIKEELKKHKANEVAESVISEYDKNSFTLNRGSQDSVVNRWSDISRGSQLDFGDAEKAADFYIAELKRIENAQSNLRQAFDDKKIDGGQYKQFADELSIERERIDGELGELVSSVTRWYGDLENATTSEATSLRDKLNGILDEFDKFKNADAGLAKAFDSVWNANQFKSVQAELLNLASAGKLTADTLNNARFKPFIEAMEKAGAIGGNTGATIDNLAKQIVKLSDKADESSDNVIQLGDKVVTLDEALVSLINTYDMVNSVSEEFSKTGTISANTLTNILKKFGEGAAVDLTENVSQYIFGLKTAGELLADLQEAYKIDEENFVSLMRNKLLSSREFFDSLNDQQKSAIDDLGATYGVDLGNYKTVQSAKLAIQAQIIRDMLGNMEKYNNATYDSLLARQSYLRDAIKTQKDAYDNSDDPLTHTARFAGQLQSLQDELQQVSATVDEIEKVNKKIDEIIGTITFTPTKFSPPSKKESKKSSALKSAKKEVELYQVKIDELRKSIKALDDVVTAIKQKEIKLDLINGDDLEGKQKAMLELLGLYTQQMKAIENLNIDRINHIIGIVNQLRSVGFNVEYDWTGHNLWIENLEHLNELGAGLSNEDRNKMIKYYEALIEKAEKYNRANIDGANEYLSLQKTIKEMQEKFFGFWKDKLGKTKESLKSVLDLVKNMIKQESEDLIDALKEQADAYAKIIKMKKASLELTEKERGYQENIRDRTKEIANLQARIDSLSMDNSREAQLERKKLLEDLAKRQEELGDYQRDHSIEAQQDALDKDLENFQKQTDDKIEEIKDFLDNQGRLTQAAMERIDKQGDALFDDLLKYALRYTSTSRSELEKMWADAMEAAREYGSFVNALDKVPGDIDGIEKGSIRHGSPAWKSVLDEIKNLGSRWGNASPDERQAISNQSLQLGHMIGANRDQNGVWWYKGEELFGGKYDTTLNGPSTFGKPQPGSSEFSSIIAQMRHLGSMWGSASPEKQKEISAASLSLGAKIGATRDQNGVWWYKGKRLFDVYHSGGTVGGDTLKSNEIFSLLERGEIVMNDGQQNRLLPLLKGAVSIREAIGRLISFGGFGSGNKQSSAQNITINDNTVVQVSDKSEFRKYLSENRREVANIVARELK